MSDEASGRWPSRSPLPPLAELDSETLTLVALFVERLRQSIEAYSDRVVLLTRAHIPGYAVATDDDIRASARSSLEDLISELSQLRTPNDAARERLEGLALQRAGQGMPLETLSLGYRLGSREMLTLMDEIASDIGLPNDLVLAMHDSTWEFANEAAAAFARIEHDRAVERVRFDGERRSGFVRGVLGGGYSVDEIHRDADLFGLDARRAYVPLAIGMPAAGSIDAVRRELATALRTTSDRLLLAEVGGTLGCIALVGPDAVSGFAVGVGTAAGLDSLAAGFAEAELAVETASLFALDGVVSLGQLGPKPLALSADAAAAKLEERHWQRLDAEGASGGPLEETMRVYLECDQQVQDAAGRLTVHPNTVRYRIGRFRALTGLDLHKTEDLITAWWLLNRRRPATDPVR